MTPTPASTTHEMIAYWQSLVEPEAEQPWDEDSVNFLFHHFRPDGNGVEKVFEGVIRGEEILPRLREVYLRTSEGSSGENSSDAYFIVRRPRPLCYAAAETLVRQHLTNILRLFEELRRPDHPAYQDVVAALNPLPEILVASGSAPESPTRDDSPDLTLYEAICDLTHELKFSRVRLESHAFLLDDAFYYLACDYLLERHLTWPLYRDLTDLQEPFAPYFELWKHGAAYRFETSDRVIVHVPYLAD